MVATIKRGRAAAVFTAVAGLLFATAGTGSAADAPTPGIDPGAEGSITITKLVDPSAVGDPAPGHEVKDHTGTPIDGVSFQIQKVPDIDLSTQAGWEAAADLTVAGAKERVKTVEPTTGVTGHLPGDADKGVVTFSGLPIGLYLVTEVSAPNNIVPSSVPFLITVPMTNPDNLSEWMYDVYVYPKNTTVTLEKSIIDADDAELGDEVEYAVTMEVPVGTTSLTIIDKLDRRLEYVDGSVAWLGDVAGSLSRKGRVLRVTFTNEAGFPAGELGFTFKAKVVGVGVIENDASYTMTVNGVPVSGESNDVLTKWGGYDVRKADEDGGPLEGAVFSLYEARTVRGEEVVTLIADDIVSGENGVVDVGGLRYSRFADNGDDVEPGDPGFVSYRLIETKAPEGRELQPQPFNFEVSGQADGDVDLEIVNVPHNAGFELPVVGGNRAVLPILAALVAVGGLAWMLRSRRRNTEA